ncbi:MAG: decaprenyl-phosphate phosphoribosyltransferase [Candidatus Abawacabacteria bacterium]|nr:decaprenyl-phosphate phosphoribosyltransferase [Candidatus Abawacabacteria bacterium]
MFKSWLKLLRPTHWAKNLLLFVPLIFSLNVFESRALYQACIAFISFSLIASTVYIINDYTDIERDKLHPVKRSRPLASGQISNTTALASLLILASASLALAYTLPLKFFFVLIVYFIANLAYSTYLKHIVIIDLLTVAACYLLRVYAGAKAIEVPITSWLLFITFFLALFVITGKRHSELQTLGSNSRPVLSAYNNEFLTMILGISATGVIVFYTLYTTTKPFLFTYSILFIVFALLRMLYWVLVRKHAEEPEKLLLKDPWLLGDIILWLLISSIALYFPNLI